MKIRSLDDVNLIGKTILLRVDYNVPIENNNIKDNFKVENSLLTIEYLLEKKCKIIIATHLGRPKGKITPSLKTDILAKELSKLLKVKVKKLDDCIGQKIQKQIKSSKNRVLMLENLRFYKEEKENDLVFAHELADLADVYINDAFAVCHRKHASVSAITKFTPSLAGLSLQREIVELKKALKPIRPAVWILGGAKLSKVKLIEQALKKADFVLIGGALVFSFMKAGGIPVGMSKIDADSVRYAKKLLKNKKYKKKIILATDFIIAEKLAPNAKATITKHILPHQIGLDLGPESVKLFQSYLRKAHTIVWNGPLGYYEWAKFASSTKAIGRFLGKLTATTICGGGETSDAIRKFHLQHELTHVSTGGGATLNFLSGEELPALKALINNKVK
jgi:3-phosphoglycerate kinase